MSFKSGWMSTAAVMVLTAASTQAQQVTTDYDHATDFAQYHTYSISKLQASDQLVEQRLREALQQTLSAKGLQMVPDGGDLTVAAVGSRANQQEYSTFYDGLGGGGFGYRRGWGGGGFGETQTTVQQIPVGTLVLDMYASTSKHLVWRGTASDTLSSKPEKNTQKLDKAVDKMLKDFPPKAK